MPTNDANSKIDSKPLYLAFSLIKAKKYDEAFEKLTEGLQNDAIAHGNTILEAVYHSTFGVLYKAQKDYKKAWKHYEKAEKLLPDDPSLKIISSRLLTDHFAQHDVVIKKMDKVIEAHSNIFGIFHQALTLKGYALLKKGNKKAAVDCLNLSKGNTFNGIESMANLDLKLVEALLKKKVALADCKLFLEAAVLASKQTREKHHELILRQLLNRWDEVFHQPEQQ